MSQGTKVVKENWSVVCKDVEQYEGMKQLLQLLGYTFPQDDWYEPSYTFICSSDIYVGGVTQGGCQEENHFKDIMSFLVFHFSAQEGYAEAIAESRQQLAEIDSQLAALQH